jgi:adenylate cyclase
MSMVARTRRRDHLLSGAGTLLAQCLAAGLPVASACSGQGACGKCVVTVIHGAEHLDPPSAGERAVLTRNSAAPNQRLSCQCKPATSADLLITAGYW